MRQRTGEQENGRDGMVRLSVSLIKRSCSLCVTITLLLTTAACDNPIIDPFANNGRFYTIYGFIDEAKNFEAGAEHTLRVIPVTRFAERIESPTDDQAFLDAVVTSTDTRTGALQRWGHTLEQLADGDFAHIFRARFFIQPGRTYRLEVHRSDGVVASAETTVPRSGSIEALLPSPRLDPASGAILQDITLTQVPSPWDIDVIYHVGGDFSTTPYRLSQGRIGTPTDEGGWRFTVNVTEDLGRLSALLGLPVSNIQFPAMGLRVRLLDGNWTPPDGVFDPEVLAQPGALSNVENGYGFWGSIGLYQHDWQVGAELRTMLGF